MIITKLVLFINNKKFTPTQLLKHQSRSTIDYTHAASQKPERQSSTPPPFRYFIFTSSLSHNISRKIFFSVRKMSDLSSKLQRKRKLALNELVMTEEKYVNHLKDLIDYFMHPLEADVRRKRRGKQRGHILKEVYIVTMFSVIKQILALNMQLLYDLQKIDPDDPDFRVGKVMRPVVPYMKLYKVYCSNHNKAMALVERCTSTKRKFVIFVREILNDPKKTNQQLQSLLIMPIQRIPRFKMLLERLLESTPETHVDFDDLTHSLKAVTYVVAQNHHHQFTQTKTLKQIHRGLRKSRNQGKGKSNQGMASTAKLVPPPPDLVKPHRVYVREGSLLKVCRRSNKSKTFFLFNDVIVYGEKLIGRSLVGYSRTIHLKRVVDMPQKEGNGIAIYGSPKSFIVLAKDHEEKMSWLKDLQKCCEMQRTKGMARMKSLKRYEKTRRGSQERGTTVGTCTQITPTSSDTTNTPQQKIGTGQLQRFVYVLQQILYCVESKTSLS